MCLQKCKFNVSTRTSLKTSRRNQAVTDFTQVERMSEEEAAWLLDQNRTMSFQIIKHTSSCDANVDMSRVYSYMVTKILWAIGAARVNLHP